MHEFFFKTKVDFSHFKVFGCRVFFFVPKSLQYKFDNNVLPGIFLGYYSLNNSYIILDISNNNIIHSHLVEIFEDNPGNSELSFPIPNKYSIFIPNSEIRRSDVYAFNKSNKPINILLNYQNLHSQYSNGNNICNNYINKYTKNDTINNKNTELNIIANIDSN